MESLEFKNKLKELKKKQLASLNVKDEKKSSQTLILKDGVD